MEWESKFSSIVRETESNLAKVKQRLSSSVHANGMVMSAGRHLGSDTEFTDQRMGLGDGRLYSNNGPHVQDYLPMTDGHLPLERSPGVIAVLQDRIETQESTIENISRTVQQLQTEKDLYHQHITGLRDEITLLNSRLAERGVDLQTERKIEKWKQEMMSEMQLIKSQLELYRTRDNSASFHASTNKGVSISSDIQHLKHFIKDQFESFHSEVNTIRIRLGKVESNLVGISTENRNLQDSHITLDRNIQGLTKSHQYTANNLANKPNERGIESQEITVLKSSIKSLSGSLERLENRLKESNGSKFGYEGVSKRCRKTRSRKHVTDFMSPDLETSDLDLSSTDYDFADFKSTDDFGESRSSDLSLSAGGTYGNDLSQGGNILGNLSALDLGDVSTADDLSDGDPLSVDDL